MSGLIYPSNLPGLTWDSSKTPVFRTGLQAALSGKESRAAYQVYPTFLFDLQYEVLRNWTTPSDLRALVGLFIAMKGRYDTFLYSDRTYNSVVDEPFGVGDGSTVAFQLIATFQNTGGPGGAEIIQNLNGTPTIKKAGVVQGSGFTIGPTGIVTFDVAPGSGQALAWTGSFYYRCRFDEDQLSVTQFMEHFWRTRSVRLKSIKL